MSIIVNNATYGQPSYFDISSPDFNPIGTPYVASGVNTPPSPGLNIAIQYGSSFGNSRRRQYLRKYTYQYNVINNIFVYNATHKGTVNYGNLQSVVDVDSINLRRSIHESLITPASAPTFITNDILHSLFRFPSHLDMFFVEGSHYVYEMSETRTLEPSNKPSWFKIFRYGKIENGQVVVCKNNPNINPRGVDP